MALRSSTAAITLLASVPNAWASILAVAGFVSNSSATGAPSSA